LRLGHHLNRDLIIRLLLHHLMVQDELVLVFKDAHLDTQFNGDAGFAFADPFVWGSKMEKTFLSCAMTSPE